MEFILSILGQNLSPSASNLQAVRAKPLRATTILRSHAQFQRRLQLPTHRRTFGMSKNFCNETERKFFAFLRIQRSLTRDK